MRDAHNLPDLTKFPEELKQRRQWVLWRYDMLKNKPDSKPTKVPYQPASKLVKAESNNPLTWGLLEHALYQLEHNKKGKFDGIGYVFSEDDPYTGIDLDWKKYRGEGIPLEAQTIIDRLGSYTEFSPSGKGCHIYVRGTLPPGGRRKSLSPAVGIEMYDSCRFFTVTGESL